MKENIRTNGTLQLVVEDIVAGTKKVFEEKNKIVNNGLQSVAKLIGGDATAMPISQIGFGDGTGATVGTETQLTNQFLKNIDSVVFPTSNKAQFNFSLGANECNGLTITELGLFTTDGALFSRKDRSPIIKTSSVIITGIWTITIN